MNAGGTLDLGVTGNCVISALIDRAGRIVWSCLPRLDGDPVFHALVHESAAADAAGFWCVEVDGCPRFEIHGRMFRPLMLVRRVRLRPAFDHGRQRPEITKGSNHARYVGPDQVLRLTTNAPVSYVLSENTFVLDRPLSFLLGADETLRDAVEGSARELWGNFPQTYSMVGIVNAATRLSQGWEKGV